MTFGRFTRVVPVSSHIFHSFWVHGVHKRLIYNSTHYSTNTVKKMAPGAKKDVKEEKILLGRPSNNLKVGIVGLPNVG